MIRVCRGLVVFESLLTSTTTILEWWKAEFGAGAGADLFEINGVGAEGITHCGWRVRGGLAIADCGLGSRPRVIPGGELFFAEVEGAFGEIEAFFGHFFAVLVHFDFVSAHLHIDFHALGANCGAGREIGEALESQELGRGVFAGGGEIAGCLHDDLVDLVRNVVALPGVDGVEVGKGQFLAGGNAGVDFIECVPFGVKVFQGLSGDIEA